MKENQINYEPLVSVELITYNQENYIKQTIESVVCQQTQYPFELIIQDDCSTDSTPEILEYYAKKYPCIINLHINKKNLGVVGNYFSNIRRCRGRYIMGIAGDDWFLPGKIEKQINFMENNPNVGMCYGKAKMFIQKKGKTSYKFGKNRVSFTDICQSNQIPACTACYKRELCNEYIHEVEPEGKDWGMEDYPMWLWFSLKSQIKFINADLSTYRVLPVSVSHSIDLQKSLDFDKKVFEIRNWFLTNYTRESEIPFEIYRIKAFEIAKRQIYSRYDVLKEFEKGKMEGEHFTKRDNLLEIICHSTVLFKILRIYWSKLGTLL